MPDVNATSRLWVRRSSTGVECVSFRVMPPLSRQCIGAIARALLFSVAVCATSAQAPDVLLFRVVDADTRLPIRGATVALAQRSDAVTPPTGPPAPLPLPPSPMPSPQSSVAVVRTDADGWFRTTAADFARGLVVSKPGYVRQSVPVTVETGSELRLRPGAVLTVRVVDAGGRPVADARVGVACDPVRGSIAPADDRGERRLSGLTPGRCRVNAEAPQPVVSPGAPDRPLPWRQGPQTVTADIRAGAETLVTVTVAVSAETTSGAGLVTAPDAGTIRGVVTGPDSGAAAGVIVQATRRGVATLDVGGFQIPPPMPRAITDARGEYVFNGLAPGSYTVNVLCPCLGWIRSGGRERPRR